MRDKTLTINDVVNFLSEYANSYIEYCKQRDCKFDQFLQ